MKVVKYRIVTDAYAGYEVQVWRLWWPFWIEVAEGVFMCNTWVSIDDAKEFIYNLKSKHNNIKNKGRVVWTD